MSEPIDIELVAGKEQMAHNEISDAYISEQNGDLDTATKRSIRSIAWSLLAISQQLGYINNILERNR